MSTITSTGNISALLSGDPVWFDDAQITGANFWADHFLYGIDDVFSGNFSENISTTNTYADVDLYGANGRALITGKGLLASSGSISNIDFSGDGGTFNFNGALQFGANGVTSVTIKSMEGHVGSEGFLMQGNLKINQNGVSGSVTRLVTYTHGMTLEYLGNFAADSDSGTLTKITLTDASGSFSIAGSYSAAIYYDAIDGATTISEVLDSAALFDKDDTLTVIDGNRDWHGFNGKDKLIGGAGGDNLFGHSGNDTLTGNAGSDYLDGGIGDDTLDGGVAADVMAGGAGNDKYMADDSADSVLETAGEGTDTVTSTASFDMSAQAQEVEILVLAGAAHIDATGNALNNTITGNAGNNRIDGGAGADKMSGGAGNDIYVVDNAGDGVTDTGGADTVEASISYVLGMNIEALALTGSDNITGTGNTGINTITGNSGNNTLNGGTGADTLMGGSGDDVYIVDSTGDVVSEIAGEGFDTVMAAATCTLGAELENLILTGTRPANGTGNAGDNTIIGNTGINTLDGGGGFDTLSGGLGNDTYVVHDINSVIVETTGGGSDTVRAEIDYALDLELENLVLLGAARVGTGNAVANTITGTNGNDTIDGGGSIDKLIGGAGDDTYYVENTRDTVSEGTNAGNDTVYSTAGSYTLGANIENLYITGNAVTAIGNGSNNLLDATGTLMANTLSGMAGNDTLDGGDYADTLIGGTGADSFVFTSTDGTSDTVTDFSRMQGDKLDISDLLIGFDPATSDITQFVRIDTVGTGSVLFVDADGGGDNFVQIATLTRATGLTNEQDLLNAGVLIAS